MEDALGASRVVELTGPRQSGKTTLVKNLVTDKVEYRTLDDPSLKVSAETDPLGFLSHSGQTLIIDEVQRVPTLITAIKKVVDENRQPGQFLITGSARIKDLPKVQESLAGRTTSIRLRTLAAGEVVLKVPDLLMRILNGEAFSDSNGGQSKETLVGKLFRGGFPEAAGKPEDRHRRRWHRNYISALLEHDLKDIDRVRDHKAMNDLIQAMAAWSGQLVNYARIGEKLAVSRPTLRSYLNVLELMFLIETLPPWTKTDYQRVGRMEKVYMCDCGLMASILDWRLDEVLLNSDRVGKIVETFVFNELSAYVDASDGDFSLSHYRDREQREIDFLVERYDGAIIGIEVKAGAVSRSDFKHLKWFQQNLVGDRQFVGVVLYRGSGAALPFGEGLWALPLSAFWSR